MKKILSHKLAGNGQPWAPSGAFYEGRGSYLRGTERFDNPYPDGHRNYGEWDSGWMKEYEKNDILVSDPPFIQSELGKHYQKPEEGRWRRTFL